jgi:hypothetical protein
MLCLLSTCMPCHFEERKCYDVLILSVAHFITAEVVDARSLSSRSRDCVYLAFLGLVDSRAPQLTELSHQLSTNH